MRVWKALLPWAVVLAALAAASGVSPTAAEEPVGEVSVRVMSFNIRLSRTDDGSNGWLRRRELVIETIRGFEGDFLGVQEAWPDQVEDLGRELPQYGRLVRSREADDRDGEAAPLFYRSDRWQPDPQQQGTFWLSRTPEVPGSRDWFSPLPRTVTWARFLPKGNGRPVYVYNTHFCHLSESARRASAELLLERIAARAWPDPAILTGDFNAGERSRTVRLLKGEEVYATTALIDTFRAAHPEADDSGTFHGFSGGREGPKVDYIFATPQVQVREAEILHHHRDDRYPSDHFPIVARVVLVTPPARQQVSSTQ